MSGSSVALKRWVQRLRSPDPEMREEGIHALELVGDTDALPALAEIFATDSDPALRALAQQAGKTIYYSAIRRALETPGASLDERLRAAEILAQARSKKDKNKRSR
ncbi:MAG: HEAT repeat domain-containing protein [Anaerolineae bacterium]|nr:HEAT repeat domain-containing protein [Anaerolineae bacterium]